VTLEITSEALRLDLDDLLQQLNRGQQVVVTRRGKAVARLHPEPRLRRPWIVGISGASGVGYAAAVIRGLLHAGEALDLIVSKTARLTLLDESGVRFRDSHWREDLAAWLAADGQAYKPADADIRYWGPADFAAGPSSGSYPSKGMVVVPASSASIAGIALGLSKDLLQRAAEVNLKERRRVVVVPRETPFTRAALQHMLALDAMGAVVLPASPGYYGRPTEVQHLIDFIAGRVLDLIGVPHMLYNRWEGVLGEGRQASAD
jgi:flavin prenyltransferase